MNIREEAIQQSVRSERELRKDLKFWEKQLRDIQKNLDKCVDGELRRTFEKLEKNAKENIAVTQEALRYK